MDSRSLNLRINPTNILFHQMGLLRCLPSIILLALIFIQCTSIYLEILLNMLFFKVKKKQIMENNGYKQSKNSITMMHLASYPFKITIDIFFIN